MIPLFYFLMMIQHYAVFLAWLPFIPGRRPPPCQCSTCCSCCSCSREAVTFSGNYSAAFLLMTQVVCTFMGVEFRSWGGSLYLHQFSSFYTAASKNTSKFERSSRIYFHISLYINFESTMLFYSIISLNNVSALSLSFWNC